MSAPVRSTPRARALLALAGVVATGCFRPLQTARLHREDPVSEAELDAGARLADRNCHPALGLLFPGLSQVCMKQVGKGTAMAVLAAAELGTGLTVGLTTEDADGDPDFGHPGAT